MKTLLLLCALPVLVMCQHREDRMWAAYAGAYREHLEAQRVSAVVDRAEEQP